ncbi:hypothetical protein FKP32DRAFT_1548313, partial [Trametes sanguinea]
LPPRGAAGAPVFDPSHPETLLDFFEDLDYMLEEAKVEDEQKKKEHAVRYAPPTQKSLWRSFSAYDEAQPYDAFKKEVIKEYLGEDGKRLYSLGDIKTLVNTYAAKGFASSSEFKVYSRSFRVIADDLVKHHVLRDDDRDRYFIKGFPEPLRAAVLDRLRYKCPDVLAPRVPYTVDQVTEAAEFVLDAQDDDGPSMRSLPAVVLPTSPIPSYAPAVKTESSQIAEALAAMAQAVSLLHQQRTTPSSAQPLRQGPPHLDPRPSQCHYCGDATHIIRRCPQVEADATAGLVKRNEAGQVVLASGSFVPSAIAGATLRDRMQEYYRQHPDARPGGTVPQMLFEPLEQEIYAAEARRQATRRDSTSSREERARRRAVRFEDPPEKAVPLPRPAARVEEVADEPTIRTSNATGASERDQVIVGTPAGTEPTPSSSTASTPPTPEHPFRNVRDATYAPPSLRNYAVSPAASTKPSTTPSRKNDAAYRSVVPVYDPKHAHEVFRRCLQTPTALTLEELLALSPEIRSATREACSTKRVPVEESERTQGSGANTGTPVVSAFLADMPSAFALAAADHTLRQVDTPPPGSLVIADPAESFLKTCAPGESLPPLVTSAHSLAIRAIEGVFKDDTKVSCILDSGSAIVSMSEGLCHRLGLHHDPDVILHMQSANGETNPSLGLARNVPVRFGNLVVYLQFHIIRSPAYDVLLGRPFDVLTESVVQTFGDGSQTITLHDPNSDIVTKVPTLPR